MAADSLVTLDFETRFPHKNWVSGWTKDAEHPDGFRYKLASARLEPRGPIELVIALEERGGARTDLERLEVPPAAFERTADLYVDGLADSSKVMFFAIDLTRCRSPAEYMRIVGDAGWNEVGT